MKKFLRWIKDHVRPHYRYNKHLRVDEQKTEHDRTEDLKDNSEIGIKIKFKF